MLVGEEEDSRQDAVMCTSMTGEQIFQDLSWVR
jgi:hypothetical protein